MIHGNGGAGRRPPAFLLLALVALTAGTLARDRRAAVSAPLHWHGNKEIVLCQLEAEDIDHFTHVRRPPPTHSSLREAGAAAAAINVNYVNFTAQQQAAFQFAVDIWAAQLTSAVPIVIDAEMDATLAPNVLGSAGPTTFFRNFTGATVANTWYPIALGNKLRGSDLSSSTSDIGVSLNPNFTWYYGTNGLTPGGQYDFVSVVLHELGHGLGFIGFAQTDGVMGTNTFSGSPAIYDRFTENGSATPIMSFASPSAALHAALTSDSIFWNGTNGRAQNGGAKPRLHAPATWSGGSSYSHLEDFAYPAGNANSLMTHALGSAEAIHDPGPIVRGMFQDEGWGPVVGGPPTCTSFSISPASANPTTAAGSQAVTITGAPSGCSGGNWTTSGNGSWLTVSPPSGSGSGSATVSWTQNSAAPSRLGTATIAGRSFPVAQNGSGPAMTLTPASLRFAGTNTAGTLSPITGTQSVTINFTPTSSSSWTATANQPWVQITNGSGTGSGTFAVSIINPGNVLGTSTTAAATITVTAPGAGNSPRLLGVTLTLRQASANVAPIGMVDTPLQNTTGVAGSIGVTGWAVDDVGIASVKLYRNCLSFEPAANCTPVGGLPLVYMGDADIVPGARPDVEAAYPTYPQNYRAGWGFLLLTNMLPHIPTQQMFGGQGNISIYVFATDIEGHVRRLGRSQADQTPTTITMANDTAVKPFGAIDTPGQGQTISGNVANFGWALTPDTDTTAGAGDIVIPTSGSTMVVWIDGAPVSTVTYNLCRGSVGSPVPAGLHCDDDVANIFGNPTPQATFTPRSANPTKYRNLDAASGAIGAYVFDTTTLSNGRHSIVWSVTDSAGRVDGIGSRYFIVLNGSGLMADGAAPEHEIRALMDAPAVALRDASEILGAPPSAGDVHGRTGFDVNASWELLMPSATDLRQVRMPELGRLELSLGAGVTDGYLKANATLRALPPGSRLDTSTGLFTWAPGLGYIGSYDLVFLQSGSQIPVRVTILPKSAWASADTHGLMSGWIDLPTTGASTSGSFTVAGWALDRGAWQGAGVGAVHVWAQRRDVPAAAPIFLGEAGLHVLRPDVGAVFGANADRSGWGLTAPALERGVYDITAYFWSTRTQQFEDARTVAVSIR